MKQNSEKLVNVQWTLPMVLWGVKQSYGFCGVESFVVAVEQMFLGWLAASWPTTDPKWKQNIQNHLHFEQIKIGLWSHSTQQSMTQSHCKAFYCNSKFQNSKISIQQFLLNILIRCRFLRMYGTNDPTIAGIWACRAAHPHRPHIYFHFNIFFISPNSIYKLSIHVIQVKYTNTCHTLVRSNAVFFCAS